MSGTPQKRRRNFAFTEWASDAESATLELCDWIETRGVEGHLMSFTRAKGFAYTTVRDWLNADPARTKSYAIARDRRADLMAEELLAIADEEPSKTPLGAVDPAAVAHQRLRVDSRKWVASKLAPRRYGDRVEVDATVNVDRIAELRDYIHRVGSRLPINSGKG